LVSKTDFDDFQSDYLGEYKAICETTLAHESGPLVGLIDEKTKRQKSCATVPLRILCDQEDRQNCGDFEKVPK
jgi:hypothetical protein